MVELPRESQTPTKGLLVTLQSEGYCAQSLGLIQRQKWDPKTPTGTAAPHLTTRGRITSWLSVAACWSPLGTGRCPNKSRTFPKMGSSTSLAVNKAPMPFWCYWTFLPWLRYECDLREGVRDVKRSQPYTITVVMNADESDKSVLTNSLWKDAMHQRRR